MSTAGIALHRGRTSAPARLWHGYRGVKPWAAAAETFGTGQDRWRALLSAASLALLAATLVGKVGGSVDLEGIAGCAYLLVAAGLAPMLLRRRTSVIAAVVVGPAISICWVLTVGFVMAETSLWQPGFAFAATAVLSGLAHLAVVARFAPPGRKARPVGRAAVPGADAEPPAGSERLAHRRPRSVFDLRNGWLATGLAVVGAAAVIVSCVTVRHLDPGPAGIFSVMPSTWYEGLLCGAFAFVLARRGPSWAAAIAAMALVAGLTATASIVYDDPQIPYGGKHVGVTEFILAHHHVLFNGDIYQAWPGLFAGAAFLVQALHISDVMLVSQWWAPLMAVTTVGGIRLLAARMGLADYWAWAAGLIYCLAGTFDESYFAPQTTAFMLAIVIFALVVPVVAETSGDRRWRLGLALWFGVVTIFTHQITPYFVVAALVALFACKVVRAIWLPIVLLVLSVAWAFAHRSILGGYVTTGAVGHVAQNAGGPTHTASLGYEPIVSLTFDGAAAVAAIIGILAIVALVRGRSLRHLGMALAAASAGLLVVVSNYGGEAVFRVVLFALPWLAVLAFSQRRADWLSLRAASGLWTAVVPLLVASFVVTSFSLDWAHVMRPGAVAADRYFEEHAPVGSVMCVTGSSLTTPTQLTARSHEVAYATRLTLGMPDPRAPYDATKDVERFAGQVPSLQRAPAYYALVAQQVGAYDALYGIESLSRYKRFAHAMAHSPLWQPVYQSRAATLYRLRPLSELPTSPQPVTAGVTTAP